MGVNNKTARRAAFLLFHKPEFNVQLVIIIVKAADLILPQVRAEGFLYNSLPGAMLR